LTKRTQDASKKKTGGNQPSKKTIEKQKQKVVEDKTFGLKNKKQIQKS